MKALILARWVALRWACQPWKWAILACMGGLWPAIHLLAPFGENQLQGRDQALNYEVAFVAAGVGVASALDALEVLPTCARALGLRPGWPLEWVALMAGGLAAQVAALALPLLMVLGGEVPVGVGLVLCTSLCSAYLAAVGLVLLRIRMPAGSRAWVLFASAWVLPALSLSSIAPMLLDAGSRPSFGAASSPTLLASQIASISALLLGVHLMDARRWRHA